MNPTGTLYPFFGLLLNVGLFIASHYVSTAHLATLHHYNICSQALENLFQFTYNPPKPLASLMCDLTLPSPLQQPLDANSPRLRQRYLWGDAVGLRSRKRGDCRACCAEDLQCTLAGSSAALSVAVGVWCDRAGKSSLISQCLPLPLNLSPPSSFPSLPSLAFSFLREFQSLNAAGVALPI